MGILGTPGCTGARQPRRILSLHHGNFSILPPSTKEGRVLLASADKESLFLICRERPRSGAQAPPPSWARRQCRRRRGPLPAKDKIGSGLGMQMRLAIDKEESGILTRNPLQKCISAGKHAAHTGPHSPAGAQASTCRMIWRPHTAGQRGQQQNATAEAVRGLR